MQFMFFVLPSFEPVVDRAEGACGCWATDDAVSLETAANESATAVTRVLCRCMATRGSSMASLRLHDDDVIG
jgi:hypothetical protein